MQEVARFDSEFERQAADYKDKKRCYDEDTGAVIRAHNLLLEDEGAKVRMTTPPPHAHCTALMCPLHVSSMRAFFVCGRW